ncbi:hypothetical protein [Mycolicibacterium aichiense]|uniref:Clp R domain-containing protein n=1 Tax=Mycolicibacterium aichiense TaxID=1799 RepID=A0AAD1HPJ0_9MYCO|nr:hypothetical protein [Mycolicibacterium aichiense]MCV7019334.1 hypothetical protein [Mycolicibacterium aichiense]BBX09247.1 hypothetical protein MAIC_40500 [Mycolicibacterium aichiense]SUA13817.1 Uncharacterised protein [Mycolicibacterium aichiense]
MIAGAPIPEGDLSAARMAQALASLNRPAEQALSGAHSVAYRYGSDVLGSAHVLMGLLADPGHLVTATLDERDSGSLAVMQLYENSYGARTRATPRIIHLPYSIHARAIVINAAGHARQQATPARRAHLWWATTGATGSIAARLLTELGQLEFLRTQLLPAISAPASPATPR